MDRVSGYVPNRVYLPEDSKDDTYDNLGQGPDDAYLEQGPDDTYDDVCQGPNSLQGFKPAPYATTSFFSEATLATKTDSNGHLHVTFSYGNTGFRHTFFTSGSTTNLESVYEAPVPDYEVPSASINTPEEWIKAILKQSNIDPSVRQLMTHCLTHEESVNLTLLDGSASGSMYEAVTPAESLVSSQPPIRRPTKRRETLYDLGEESGVGDSPSSSVKETQLGAVLPGSAGSHTATNHSATYDLGHAESTYGEAKTPIYDNKSPKGYPPIVKEHAQYDLGHAESTYGTTPANLFGATHDEATTEEDVYEPVDAATLMSKAPSSNATDNSRAILIFSCGHIGHAASTCCGQESCQNDIYSAGKALKIQFPPEKRAVVIPESKNQENRSYLRIATDFVWGRGLCSNWGKYYGRRAITLASGGLAVAAVIAARQLASSSTASSPYTEQDAIALNNCTDSLITSATQNLTSVLTSFPVNTTGLAVFNQTALAIRNAALSGLRAAPCDLTMGDVISAASTVLTVAGAGILAACKQNINLNLTPLQNLPITPTNINRVSTVFLNATSDPACVTLSTTSSSSSTTTRTSSASSSSSSTRQASSSTPASSSSSTSLSTSAAATSSSAALTSTQQALSTTQATTASLTTFFTTLAQQINTTTASGTTPTLSPATTASLTTFFTTLAQATTQTDNPTTLSTFLTTLAQAISSTSTSTTTSTPNPTTTVLTTFLTTLAQTMSSPSTAPMTTLFTTLAPTTTSTSSTPSPTTILTTFLTSLATTSSTLAPTSSTSTPLTTLLSTLVTSLSTTISSTTPAPTSTTPLTTSSTTTSTTSSTAAPATTSTTPLTTSSTTTSTTSSTAAPATTSTTPLTTSSTTTSTTSSSTALTTLFSTLQSTMTSLSSLTSKPTTTSVLTTLTTVLTTSTSTTSSSTTTAPTTASTTATTTTALATLATTTRGCRGGC